MKCAVFYKDAEDVGRYNAYCPYILTGGESGWLDAAHKFCMFT